MTLSTFIFFSFPRNADNDLSIRKGVLAFCSTFHCLALSFVMFPLSFLRVDIARDIRVARLIHQQPSIRDTPGFYTWVAALLDLLLKSNYFLQLLLLSALSIIYQLTLYTTNREAAPASNARAINYEQNRRRHDQRRQAGQQSS
jgi:hypothetical protein